VAFSTTTGGSLLHGSSGVTTHSDGRAIDVLTVQPGAPASITVTATSAALTKTVMIATTAGGVCAGNTPPTASIVPSSTQLIPAGSVTTHPTVHFSSTVFDLENEVQTYSWDCGNGTSAVTTDQVTCTYDYVLATAKTYTVTLTVTDGGLNGHSECIKSGDAAPVEVDVAAGTP
jgi:PKD repeat protein